MRIVIVGLGAQGKKRARIAVDTVVGTVDPWVAQATYQKIEQVPLDSFDAAYVCTPDHAKCALLRYLLSHKKHVLVEKPLLDTTGAELQQFVVAARRVGATCYTAFNHRFEPHLVCLKELVTAGVLGQLYFARMFYGNGTARDVRNSPWRDQGLGVLSDLGSHLLDLFLFLFGKTKRSFTLRGANCFENKAFDHVVFSSQGELPCVFEMTLLSWKNSFGVDLYGELGSAHVEGLCKWGPTKLIVRHRVFPSGKPAVEEKVLECEDPTWAAEHRFFQTLCETGGNNLENDIWIQGALNEVAAQFNAKPSS